MKWDKFQSWRLSVKSTSMHRIHALSASSPYFTMLVECKIMMKLGEYMQVLDQMQRASLIRWWCHLTLIAHTAGLMHHHQGAHITVFIFHFPWRQKWKIGSELAINYPFQDDPFCWNCWALGNGTLICSGETTQPSYWFPPPGGFPENQYCDVTWIGSSLSDIGLSPEPLSHRVFYEKKTLGENDHPTNFNRKTVRETLHFLSIECDGY